MLNEGTSCWPVDGHVHFHRLSEVAPTLDAAVTNFRSAGNVAEDMRGMLLLTQGSRERVFESLLATPRLGDWAFTRVAGEQESIVARRGSEALAIVCGRQVRSAEGLEVLALGTVASFDDGLPFDAAIDLALRATPIVVIPWGFGKWIGKRAVLVDKVLAALGPQQVFVGDNGGRLALGGLPTAVARAGRQGFRVLPGTDPFPFGRDCRRVGSFGFLAPSCPDEAAPWRSLRSFLLSHRDSPVPYGHALGPARFMINQVGIQAFNRFGRGRAA